MFSVLTLRDFALISVTAIVTSVSNCSVQGIAGHVSSIFSDATVPAVSMEEPFADSPAFTNERIGFGHASVLAIECRSGDPSQDVLVTGVLPDHAAERAIQLLGWRPAVSVVVEGAIRNESLTGTLVIRRATWDVVSFSPANTDACVHADLLVDPGQFAGAPPIPSQAAIVGAPMGGPVDSVTWDPISIPPATGLLPPARLSLESGATVTYEIEPASELAWQTSTTFERSGVYAIRVAFEVRGDGLDGWIYGPTREFSVIAMADLDPARLTHTSLPEAGE